MSMYQRYYGDKAAPKQKNYIIAGGRRNSPTRNLMAAQIYAEMARNCLLKAKSVLADEADDLLKEIEFQIKEEKQ